MMHTAKEVPAGALQGTDTKMAMDGYGDTISQAYLHSRQQRCARSRRGTCTYTPVAQPLQLMGRCVSPGPLQSDATNTAA